MTATCPKCPLDGFANPGALAAHLIDAHDMAGIAALALARSTVPHEEAPMKSCKNCGGDHRSDNKLCPKKLGAASPLAAKKRKAITKNHPRKPKRTTASTNGQPGAGLLLELDALRATAAALDPLGPVERLHVLACVAKLLAIDTAELAT